MSLLIEIAVTLWRCFLPRPKKMTLSSKIIELRDKVLENCNYAVSRLEAANRIVLDFTSSNKKDTTTSTSGGDKKDTTTSSSGEDKHGDIRSVDNTSYGVTDLEIKNSFMILTHGALIQEWEHFLYDIFVEGVIYYLKGYNLSDSTYKLSLKNLRPPIEFAEMREILSEESRESLRGYKELFKHTRTLFNVEEPELFREMQTQVQIRHIFQHNRGKIRSRDLKDVGKEGGSFDILNDEGTVMPYGEGEDILLSLPEIRKLYTVIDKYSEAFQQEAEKAKPPIGG